jgi:hypothetical protein
MNEIIIEEIIYNVDLNIEEEVFEVCIEISEMQMPGKDAYEVAVENGFVGTVEEWLESLKAKTYIRRHDFVSDVSYCGFAEIGSLETDSVWNISKIVVAIEGTTTTTHAANVKWSDRLTVIYS